MSITIARSPRVTWRYIVFTRQRGMLSSMIYKLRVGGLVLQVEVR